MDDDFTPDRPNIFISYAHIDNEEPPEWVDSFADELRRKVMVRLGERPKIWKDRLRLKGNDLLQQVVIPAVRNSMVIVSVISPGYISSAWCKAELSAFCDAHAAGDLSIGGKSRVFKIVKLPPPDLTKLGDVPELLDTTGDEFFSHDGKKAVSWDPARDAERFKEKVDDVALAIVQILGELVGGDGYLGCSGLKVYLAPSTYDMRGERQTLRNALRLSGHVVLETDPVSTPDYEQRVRTQLAQADMSVHPIGDNYAMLENSDELVEATAYRLANDAAKLRPGFVRIAWRLSRNALDDRKRAFVSALSDDVAQDNMQYVVTSLEELKSYLNDCAQTVLASRNGAVHRDASAPPPATRRRKTVYLTWDVNADGAVGTPSAAAIAAIRKYLFDRQLEVRKQLAADGDREKARQFHERMLRTSDAVLVYHGEGDPTWVESTIADLEDRTRGRGFGDGGYDACAVVFGPPSTEYKGDYMSHDVPEIVGADPFDPAVLAPFVASLQGARA